MKSSGRLEFLNNRRRNSSQYSSRSHLFRRLTLTVRALKKRRRRHDLRRKSHLFRKLTLTLILTVIAVRSKNLHHRRRKLLRKRVTQTRIVIAIAMRRIKRLRLRKSKILGMRVTMIHPLMMIKTLAKTLTLSQNRIRVKIKAMMICLLHE